MGDMVIRVASIDDIQQIEDINRKAWSGATVAQLREERHGIIGNKPWYEHKCSQIRAIFKRDPKQFIVAEAKGKILGYASFSYSEENRLGVVGHNAVDPDYRGRGIGTRLIAEAVQILKDKGAMLLQVTTLLHDKPARRVYEKVGFVEIARSVHYTMDVR